MTFPVIHCVRSSINAAIASATSWGVVSRPPGFRALANSASCSIPGILLDPGVMVTPAWMAMLTGYIVCSCAVAVGFSYLLGCLAFWAPRAAEEISSSAMRVITGLKGFPLDGAGRLLTSSLLTIVPVGLVAWQPCAVLLNVRAPVSNPLFLPLATVVFCVVTAVCFRMGLKEYGRTGSQRYLSLGHRR